MLAAELFAPAPAAGLLSIGFLVNAWIKAGVLLAMAGLLTAFLKKSPASARHAVWGIGLLALLALPLLSLLLPPLNIPLLPAGAGLPAGTGLPAGAGSTAGHMKQAEAVDRLAGAQPIQVPALVESSAGNARRTAEARQPAVPTAPALEPAFLNSPIDEGAIAPAQKAMRQQLALILALVWLTGFVVSLSRWLAGLISAQMIVRRSKPVASAECMGDFSDLSHSLALCRAVRLLEYDGGSMPLTCGIIRPAIVLPTCHGDWPHERRKIVLLHELSHVKRWDCLAQAMAQIACAFYWLNPLVWFAARRLRLESENACDDVVIGSGTRASDYAGHLLEIARAFGVTNGSPWGVLTIARPSELESRLRSILTPDRQNQAGGERLRPALVSLGLISIALALAAVAPCPSKVAAQGKATAGATNRISPPGPIQDLLPSYTASTGLPVHARELEREEARAMDQSQAGRPSGSLADGFAARARDKNSKSIDQLLQDAAAGVFEARASHEIAVESATGSAQTGNATSQDGLAGDQQGKIDSGVEALIGALKDDNEQVRAQAAWALGMNGNHRSVEALISALKDQSAQVRAQAAWGLGLKGDGRAVEPLASALKDPQPHVRSQAAWALGLKGDNRSVEPLISALKDQSTQVRSQAAWALGLKGDNRSIEPLMSALNDESPHVRSQAAWALGLKGDARAVDGLKALLNDSVNQVRRQAQWALGMLLMRSSGQGDDEHEDESAGNDTESDSAHRHQHSNPRPRPYGRLRPNPNPGVTVDPAFKCAK